MKLYPDSSESCGCNPGKHLYVYTSQRMSSAHGRGSEYQHPAGLSPRLEQLGSLTIAQDNFVKISAFINRNYKCVLCHPHGHAARPEGKSPFKWCEISFPLQLPNVAPHPRQPCPCWGGAAVAPAKRAAWQKLPQRNRGLAFTKYEVFLSILCLQPNRKNAPHFFLCSKILINSSESWCTDFKHEFSVILVSAACRNLSGPLEFCFMYVQANGSY